MNENLAPIVLFTYNRPHHLKKTIAALKQNKLSKYSELFIFSDGPKNNNIDENIKEVREYLDKIVGFKKVIIIKREKNCGLANNIINGVTHIINKYGKVIVMEDDLITAPNFLKYMNKALDFYKNNKNIFSITGLNFPIEIPNDYAYEVYFSYRCSSWGWGTWKDRWNKVDWEVKDFNEFVKDKNAQKLFNRGGEDLSNMLKLQMSNKIDSWAIRWSYAHHKNSTYCVYPVISKILNIGMDKSGTHCRASSKFEVDLDKSDNNVKLTNHVQTDERIIKNFQAFFKTDWKKRIKLIIIKLIIK
ncbi:MAG: glycosyltransferase [Patescibacteria group bacterium]